MGQGGLAPALVPAEANLDVGAETAMNVLTKLRHALLGRRQAAALRVADPPVPAPIDELPPFTLAVAERMRYDPQVRIGIGARNGLLMAAQVEVRGDDPDLVQWVEQQWQTVWHGYAHRLLRAKLYGFVPLEVVYRRIRRGRLRGMLEIERLTDHPPRAARLLLEGDQIAGFVLFDGAGAEATALSTAGPLSEEIERTPSAARRLIAPQALVCTFDAECGNPYGCALLARAYPAWLEKWMPGGAKRTLQLRMVKDAYIGDIFWYPPERRFVLPDGREVSFGELARQIVAARHSGGALTLPLVRDAQGHKLIDYTPPQSVPGHTPIFRWKTDLDLEIWKALEVPPEVIQAQASGSGYSGRWIPFAVALSAVHQELAELIRCLDRDVLRPVAELNFGSGAYYAIRPRSLVEIYAAMFGTPRSTPPQEG